MLIFLLCFCNPEQKYTILIPFLSFDPTVTHCCKYELTISCQNFLHFVPVCQAIISYISNKLSKPKLNHPLNSTEFEVRLHSYREIHHHPPTTTQTQLVYSKLGRADNCPASKKGPSVQAYSHTQTSEATLYYVFAAEL